MNRYSRGVWAGSIRYYKGTFYLVFGTPDEGYFITSSCKPQGPWKPLCHLLKEAGWDDCCIDWDEEGNPFFVGTNFKDGYKTYLFRMSKEMNSINMLSCPVIFSFHFFVVNPENIGSHHIYSSRLHLQKFIAPLPFRITGKMELPHYRQHRLPVQQHGGMY